VNLAVPTARFTDRQDAAFRRELRSAAAALAQVLRVESIAAHGMQGALSSQGRDGARRLAPSH
jgi:hypothetical protein